jgi:Lon protease-like protein
MRRSRLPVLPRPISSLGSRFSMLRTGMVGPAGGGPTGRLARSTPLPSAPAGCYNPGEPMDGGCSDIPINFQQWIPLVPLPNAVLLPRSVLPLHIFEPRYRTMTREALHGARLMSIALLKPGYQCVYHTLHAEIHPIVGVGRIIKHEELTDGRFHLLLGGVTRGRVVTEDRSRVYRLARIEPIDPCAAGVESEVECRRMLRDALVEGPLGKAAEQSGWLRLFQCQEMQISDLLDALAAVVLTDPAARQQFLEEASVLRRARLLLGRLESPARGLGVAALVGSRAARGWPPHESAN